MKGLILALTIALGLMSIVYVPGCIEIKQDITSPLKKAADAPTLDLAIDQLNDAITGIEDHGLDQGSSHLIYPTSSTDLGLWYKHLTAVRDEIVKMESDSTITSTDINLQLVKLREVILDAGSEGRQKVTSPPHLVMYPYHKPFVVFSLIFGLIWIILISMWVDS